MLISNYACFTTISFRYAIVCIFTKFYELKKRKGYAEICFVYFVCIKEIETIHSKENTEKEHRYYV